MKYLEPPLSFHHKMKYDRSVASIGDMLDPAQQPLTPQLLSTRQCPAT